MLFSKDHKKSKFEVVIYLPLMLASDTYDMLNDGRSLSLSSSGRVGGECCRLAEFTVMILRKHFLNEKNLLLATYYRLFDAKYILKLTNYLNRHKEVLRSGLVFHNDFIASEAWWSNKRGQMSEHFIYHRHNLIQCGPSFF